MIYVIPLIIALVLITAMIKKLPSYELFIDGAEEGMKIVSGIFPPLVAVLTAAYMPVSYTHLRAPRDRG